MIDNLAFADFASATVERAVPFVAVPPPGHGDISELMVGGVFTIECRDRHGRIRWVEEARNGVTSIGLDHILNVIFRSTTAITAWYIGLIDNASFSALAAADTMASHAGWAEVGGANYSNSTRVAWSPGAPAANAIVNGTSADFSMVNSGSLTVKGLFLVSDSTKAGTTGTLFSTAVFTGGTQAVNSGDTLKVTYTMSAAST